MWVAIKVLYGFIIEKSFGCSIRDSQVEAETQPRRPKKRCHTTRGFIKCLLHPKRVGQLYNIGRVVDKAQIVASIAKVALDEYNLIILDSSDRKSASKL